MLQQTLAKETVVMYFYRFLLQNGEINTNDELDLHANEWNKSLHPAFYYYSICNHHSFRILSLHKNEFFFGLKRIVLYFS